MNKKELLFDALTGVEPEYLKEADGFDFNRTVSKRPMRWAAAAAACLALGAAFGIAYSVIDEARIGKDVDPAELAMLETYPETPIELETIYDHLDDMAADAECIALVEVKRCWTEYEENELPGWPAWEEYYAELKIKEVYKGEERPGRVIKLHESPSKLLSEGKKYVLFMDRNEDVYFICGVFQGKFTVIDGYVVQHRSEDVGLEDYTPVSLNEFKQLIGK